MRKRVIRDDRLMGLYEACFECGEPMTSVGEMFQYEGIDKWFIAYWCKNDEEVFPIYNPDRNELTQEIASEYDIESLPYVE